MNVGLIVLQLSGMEEVNEPVQLGSISLEEIKQGAVTLEGIQLGGVTDDGIMISNLPLLFADGNPTCLEKFTVSQLEKFIPFMVKCSVGHYKGQEIPAPKWWPPDVSFSLSLKKPLYLDNARWLALLKSLVCRCYTYHGCEFMLRFCTELSAVSSTTFKYVNGWDGTTSLYNKHSGKLMVTFRNENRTYDKKPEFPRRSLLPKNQTPKPDILLQTPVYDIYLCDKCDGEFDTLQDVKEHEKICCQEEPNAGTRSASPEDLFPNNQHSFLNYFGLKSIDSEEEPNEKESPVRQRRCKRRFPIGVTFTRGCAIPFTSPLGLVIHRKSRMAAVNTQVHLERLERYCDGKISQQKSRPKERELSERSQDLIEWPVSWKPPLPKKDKEAWTHQYCFSRSKRKRKWLYRRSHSGLNRNSEQLLRLCQPVTVVLTRLTDEEIAHYTEGSNSPTLMEYNPVYKCRLPKLLPNTVYTYSEHAGEYGGYGIEPSIPVIDLCSTDEEDDSENVTMTPLSESDQHLLPMSDFTGNENLPESVNGDTSDIDTDVDVVYEEGADVNSEANVYSNGYQYVTSDTVTNWGNAVFSDIQHSVFSMPLTQSSNVAYAPSLCVPTYPVSSSSHVPVSSGTQTLRHESKHTSDEAVLHGTKMEEIPLHKRLGALGYESAVSTSTQDASKNDICGKLRKLEKSKQANLKTTALWLMQQKLPLSVRRLQQDECRELHRRGLNSVMSKCGRVLRSSNQTQVVSSKEIQAVQHSTNKLTSWNQFKNSQSMHFPNKRHGRVVAVSLSDLDSELELITGNTDGDHMEADNFNVNAKLLITDHCEDYWEDMRCLQSHNADHLAANSNDGETKRNLLDVSSPDIKLKGSKKISCSVEDDIGPTCCCTVPETLNCTAAPDAHLLANYTSVQGLLTYSFRDQGGFNYISPLLMLTVGHQQGEFCVAEKGKTTEKTSVSSISETKCKGKKKLRNKISGTKAVHMKSSSAYFTPVHYSKSDSLLESKIKFCESSYKNTVKPCHLNGRNIRKDLKKLDKFKVTKVPSLAKSANETNKVLSFPLPMFGSCKNMGKQVLQNHCN